MLVRREDYFGGGGPGRMPSERLWRLGQGTRPNVSIRKSSRTRMVHKVLNYNSSGATATIGVDAGKWLCHFMLR
jgi:hypothetical protein